MGRDRRRDRSMIDINLHAFIPAATTADVDTERDRRLEIGFTYSGKTFQSDERSIARINGAVSGALVATQSGAQPGDLYWADKTSPFAWIASDNTIMPMDAPTVIEFGQTGMAYVSFLTFRAKAIKDRIRAGERIIDVQSDALWAP
jgi:hypothetical protein